MLNVRWLAKLDYIPCWQAMKQFTHNRDENTHDEIWLLEHTPVFTQGQNGKPEHILSPGIIPIVKTDRGGQVTYHGPGQLMVYTLIDLRRKKLNVREFVTILEQSVIDLLAESKVNAYAKREAPGVYIKETGEEREKKICSIGLRIRQGCTYHGIALNVNMDLKPFNLINPCGFVDLKMTQLAEYYKFATLESAHTDFKHSEPQPLTVGRKLVNYLMEYLVYNQQTWLENENKLDHLHFQCQKLIQNTL